MNSYAKTTHSYSGRTVDMLLLKTVDRPVASKKVSPDVSGNIMAVSGIEKLVQRFALLFLTINGSVGLSSEGTDIVGDMANGMIYDEATLRASAVSSADEVSRQIKEADASEDTPDDEALDTADVIDLSIDRISSTAFVTVFITTLAGTSYTYVAPVSTGV